MNAIGGGGNFPPSPPANADWTLVNTTPTFATAALVNIVCPAGADGWDLAYGFDTDPPNVPQYTSIPCDFSQDLFSATSVQARVKIRWSLAGVAVSGWSAIKTIQINANRLLNGLLAYWKLDESGTPVTLADATGNGWDGTNHSVTMTISGKINNGAAITGAAQGIAVSTNLDTRASSAPFSISLWFLNTGGGASGKAAIGEWGTRNDFVLFNLVAQTATFRASDDSGTTTDVTTTALTLWAHLVFGFDGSNIFIYLNAGVPVTAAKAAVRRGGGNFVIGNYQGFSLAWEGTIDEVAYYNRALSATDVANLYNSGNGLPFSSFD
jgi:hypothetical protein